MTLSQERESTMSPSEVLYAYKVVGAKIHQAGVIFGETKKATDPADARRRLAASANALRDALTTIEKLMR
jgi:sugar (pentulose or hexulose) kinase